MQLIITQCLSQARINWEGLVGGASGVKLGNDGGVIQMSCILWGCQCVCLY